MIIVSGEFRFAADQRDDFVAGQVDNMKASRAQAGCIDFTFMAHPTDPERVILYESWEDPASLDAQLTAPRTPSTKPDIAPTAAVDRRLRHRGGATAPLMRDTADRAHRLEMS